MSVLYTNNASTTLATGITSGSTSISVSSGKGSLFPAISGSDFFFVTISNNEGTNEIVKVTARSTDTLTVVRGQDGTTAAAWNAGDKVELRVTKGLLDQLKIDAVNGYASASSLSSHTGNTSNPHSVTATQVGLGNVENKSSATIRGEITSSNVTTALGFTPLSTTGKAADSDLLDGQHAAYYATATHNHNGTYQAADADLTAIAALAGTSGLLKKTAADTWTLDTNTYVTSSGVTSVTGTAPIVSSGGTTPAISISAATTSAAGSMSATDKTKLDGIATGATANTGTVTSVGGTGSYGGLTLSGTVTTSGNLTLGGTPTGTWPISISGSSVSCTGNAATATTAGTASTVSATGATNLYSPNGSTVVSGDASTALPSTANSLIHTLGTGPSGNDGHILGMTWTGTGVYGAQIWLDTDPTSTMAVRSRSSAGVWNTWANVITSLNIGSQSVNYATSAGSASSAGNADTLDGNHASAFSLTSHNHNGTYLTSVPAATSSTYGGVKVSLSGTTLTITV